MFWARSLTESVIANLIAASIIGGGAAFVGTLSNLPVTSQMLIGVGAFGIALLVLMLMAIRVDRRVKAEIPKQALAPRKYEVLAGHDGIRIDEGIGIAKVTLYLDVVNFSQETVRVEAATLRLDAIEKFSLYAPGIIGPQSHKRFETGREVNQEQKATLLARNGEVHIDGLVTMSVGPERIDVPIVADGLLVRHYGGIVSAVPSKIPASASHQQTILEAFDQSRSLSLLRFLREVGTHMLLNRPPTDNQARLQENLVWWKHEVMNAAPKAGATDSTISRFKTLGIVYSGSLIVESLARLDEILWETETAVRKRVESVAERITALRQRVLSSHTVDHSRRVVELVLFNSQAITPQDSRLYHSIETELLALGYRATGWPQH